MSCEFIAMIGLRVGIAWQILMEKKNSISWVVPHKLSLKYPKQTKDNLNVATVMLK